MKVLNIDILHDLEACDIENDNVDVFVETDDGFSYTLSVGTPRNVQFLMEQEKMDYYGPGYPFILVTKLTREIIEQAVHAFVEEEGGYWLKVYHFGGWSGAIDESIFDQLKAKRLKEEKELDELNHSLDEEEKVEEELEKLLDELDEFLNFPKM